MYALRTQKINNFRSFDDVIHRIISKYILLQCGVNYVMLGGRKPKRRMNNNISLKRTDFPLTF